MKLGKETGSIVNAAMGNTKTVPQVGKGATILYWTDRDAYEVLDVRKDGKECDIQAYDPKRIDSNGMSEVQIYSYEKLIGPVITLVYKYKSWRYKTSNAKVNIIFGVKHHYYDYSF